MSLPSFFLVGAPKCGTTTLFERIGLHPDVYVSPVKEPHYFTAVHDGWPEWGVQTLAAYEALFDGADGAREVGEGSTWYLYSPTAAAAIHAEVPEAKILISLRNPVERAYSAWAYNVEKGWEDLPFDAALAREDERYQRPGFWDRHYVRAGLYADQVERYLDTFGADRVHVVLFDDVRSDEAGVLRGVFDFLGVEAHTESVAAPLSDGARNATRYPRSTRIARFTRSKAVRKIATWLPDSIRRRVRTGVAKVNTVDRPEMEPATRQELEARFRPDVERLQGYLGRPLVSQWFGQ